MTFRANLYRMKGLDSFSFLAVHMLGILANAARLVKEFAPRTRFHRDFEKAAFDVLGAVAWDGGKVEADQGEFVANSLSVVAFGHIIVAFGPMIVAFG